MEPPQTPPPPPPPFDETPPSPVPPPAAPASARRAWVRRIVGVAVGGAALVAGILATTGGDGDSATTTVSTTTVSTTTVSAPSSTAAPLTVESTTTTNSTVATTTSTPEPAGTPYRFEELDLEYGLFCRDLVAAGTTYADAVRYWYRESGPPRMDADANGIPCETVYDAAIVDAYWSVAHPAVAVETVARWVLPCGYTITHVIDTDDLPDGTTDVTLSFDVGGDGIRDHVGQFNVYSGFDIFATGPGGIPTDESIAILDCAY